MFPVAFIDNRTFNPFKKLILLCRKALMRQTLLTIVISGIIEVSSQISL